MAGGIRGKWKVQNIGWTEDALRAACRVVVALANRRVNQDEGVLLIEDGRDVFDPAVAAVPYSIQWFFWRD